MKWLQKLLNDKLVIIKLHLQQFVIKLLQKEITPLINEFLHIDVRNQSFLSSPFYTNTSFHAHSELELVFIFVGAGKRIIWQQSRIF